MSEPSNLVIQALDKHHERDKFSCGNGSLDNYLRKQAKQDIRRRISRVFVATSDDKSKAILGYYSLSSLSIDLSLLPEVLASKLPKHPVPAAVIGRLAVDSKYHGRGVGKMLLADAITRTLSVGEQIAIYAMAVDAIDANAQSFYQAFGFQRLGSDSNRLSLPLRSWV